MPRFYFDIHDGCRQTLDDEGTELPDVQRACEEAVAVLPEIVGREHGPTGDRDIVATVRTEDGAPVFRARLSVRSEWLGSPAGEMPVR